jgi:hypothetical protein
MEWNEEQKNEVEGNKGRGMRREKDGGDILEGVGCRENEYG